MTIVTIAENPQQSKERPHLPDLVDDFNEVLWREIDRAPSGLPAFRLAQIVAETIARDYEMSPGTQNHLIRVGLIRYLAVLLEPEEAQP